MLPKSGINKIKSKVPLIVICGDAKRGKSILSQHIANELNFKIFETEYARPYFKKVEHITDLNELKKAVLSTHEPILIDSISDPYQSAMNKVPYYETSPIISDVKDILKHTRKYGGIIVSHGKFIETPIDTLNRDKSYIPQGEYELYGNKMLSFVYDGIVVVGTGRTPNERSILTYGRHMKRQIRDFTISGSESKPSIEGNAVNYLLNLLKPKL